MHPVEMTPAVRKIAKEYGVEPGFPPLGRGAFKYAFWARDKAVLISRHIKSFLDEIEALERLHSIGVPCLMYEDWQSVDDMVVAVSPMCRRPSFDDYFLILGMLKKWAIPICESETTFYDMQVLISFDGKPVIHDPCGLFPSRMVSIPVKAVGEKNNFEVRVYVEDENVIESSSQPVEF